ncbi:MAG: serine/threonine-protein phosphatase, partial [Chloroflexia bacterium]|nr:serine/threonine-protein phosphatase [Chloroflexia bacterium]
MSVTHKLSSQEPAASNGAGLRIGSCTEAAGREVNEDNCTQKALSRTEQAHLGTLIAVADGMGGGEAGQSASSLAIAAVGEAYFESGSDEPLRSLQHAVNQANSAVYAFTVNSSKSRTVGTTMVAAAIVGSRAYLVNVGDSQAYLIRDGQARLLTKDHNWANQQIELGRLSAEQAFAHENAPLLTHVLGQGANLQIPLGGTADGKFSFELDLQPGDALVLCTDGVSGVVPADELGRLALQGDAPQAASRIVARAKALQTKDNATALVIHYGRKVGLLGGVPQWVLLAGGAAAIILALLAATLLAFSGNNDETGGLTPTANAGAPRQINVGATVTPTEEPTPAPGETRRPTSTGLPVTDTPVPTSTNTPRPTSPPPTPGGPGATRVPTTRVPTTRVPTTQAPGITSLPTL